MRIRVPIYVRIPLKMRKKVRMENGAWAIIEFKYERRGTFCILCGHMGHSYHFCKILFQTSMEDLERGWAHGSKRRRDVPVDPEENDVCGRKERQSREG